LQLYEVSRDSWAEFQKNFESASAVHCVMWGELDVENIEMFPRFSYG